MKVVKGNAITYLKEYDGPILLAHQVNCQGIAGAGIAKQIVNEFPLVGELYRKRCSLELDRNNLLGISQMVWLENHPEKFIVNLFSQFNYGRDKRYTNYAAMGQALMTMRDLLENNKSRIIFPYGIGCGLAGGNWNIVEQIIVDVFPDCYFIDLTGKA